MEKYEVLGYHYTEFKNVIIYLINYDDRNLYSIIIEKYGAKRFNIYCKSNAKDFVSNTLKSRSHECWYIPISNQGLKLDLSIKNNNKEYININSYPKGLRDLSRILYFNYITGEIDIFAENSMFEKVGNLEGDERLLKKYLEFNGRPVLDITKNESCVNSDENEELIKDEKYEVLGYQYNEFNNVVLYLLNCEDRDLYRVIIEKVGSKNFDICCVSDKKDFAVNIIKSNRRKCWYIPRYGIELNLSIKNNIKEYNNIISYPIGLKDLSRILYFNYMTGEIDMFAENPSFKKIGKLEDNEEVFTKLCNLFSDVTILNTEEDKNHIIDESKHLEYENKINELKKDVETLVRLIRRYGLNI